MKLVSRSVKSRVFVMMTMPMMMMMMMTTTMIMTLPLNVTIMIVMMAIMIINSVAVASSDLLGLPTKSLPLSPLVFSGRISRLSPLQTLHHHHHCISNHDRHLMPSLQCPFTAHHQHNTKMSHARCPIGAFPIAALQI